MTCVLLVEDDIVGPTSAGLVSAPRRHGWGRSSQPRVCGVGLLGYGAALNDVVVLAADLERTG
ncbi:hypothetical protein [Streptosporangium sp. NPDC006007]|uniref:hypothetical protein n=1 Tax=Streptosporangium sp. NPDC006007 TaxID=3154575 RepID=UPI0033B6D7C5